MSRIEDTHPEPFEEAERLLGYWEQHGNDARTVTQWAVQDMLAFLRLIVPTD